MRIVDSDWKPTHPDAYGAPDNVGDGEEARQLAMARGNASAAVLAVIAKARLHGCISRDRALPVQNTVVEGTSERQEGPREIARLIAFALAIGRREIDQQGRD